MSTSNMQESVILGLGEGGLISDSTMLSYSLRWINAVYKNIFLRYRFKSLRTRTIFRTSDGQSTYQAPADFSGFLTMKDETSENILGQVTPEEFARDVGTKKVTDESFTSSSDTAVSLDNQGIVQYSETVTNTAGTTTYTRDSDYTMNYASGMITMDSTGTMVNDIEYYIDYLYYPDGKPDEFCIEYDSTNKRYVFRLRPCPDGTYICSLLYPAFPSDLSSSVDPVWDKLEFCLERGGIYYGSLELRQSNDPSIDRFKMEYEQAVQSLIQLDSDLVPKHAQIKVVMKKTDYE